MYVWGRQKGGLVNLQFIMFLNSPYIQISLFVWDSGVLSLNNLLMKNEEIVSCRSVGLLTLLFGSTDSVCWMEVNLLRDTALRSSSRLGEHKPGRIKPGRIKRAALPLQNQ